MSKFGVWNSMKKEFQWQSCDSDTPEEVWVKLKKEIGHDAKKWRFQVVDKEKQLKKIETNKIGLKTVIWFGKYKGKMIKEIKKEDPNYIVWLIENTNKEFKKELLEEK